jgi:hypothetical protein
MSQPVVIENDAIRMEVWPQIGGKVGSILDKADQFELMFNYASELPTVPRYDARFEDSWHAGWDECFPAIAPGRYVGHPYDGIAVPDHGELWGLPTTAVPTKDGITTVWHGLRFGYRLTRKLHLDGPAVLADYTLVNLAPFEFRFVWAAHALMAMHQSVQLELSEPATFHHGLNADGLEHHPPFQWPMALADVDLSRPDSLPAKRRWKVYSQESITSPVTVRYPGRGRSVSIAYSSDDGLAAYWGIWINTGGWGGHKHFAIEPTTGRFDQIDQSIWDSSAGRVAPMGRRDWSMRWNLGNE